MFVLGRPPFQPLLISRLDPTPVLLSRVGSPTALGSPPYPQTMTSHERTARDEHSSLSRTFAKSFMTLGPRRTPLCWRPSWSCCRRSPKSSTTFGGTNNRGRRKSCRRSHGPTFSATRRRRFPDAPRRRCRWTSCRSGRPAPAPAPSRRRRWSPRRKSPTGNSRNQKPKLRRESPTSGRWNCHLVTKLLNFLRL